MEAVTTMYRDVGLNAKLRMLEIGVYQGFRDKPFPTNVPPYLLQNQHDNMSGDAVFTVFAKYHCKGAGSPICDQQLDDLIEKATVTTGEERRKLWQAAFKRIHEELIPDVMLFHMVGYCRVGKRINFQPTVALNSEVQAAQITFK
jgi:peptide/nickel transport system substrate-binding protein